MGRQQRVLLIFGGQTYLGLEVARFARAMEHRVISVVPGAPPPLEHPWMHGVQWIDQAHQEDSVASLAVQPGAMIYCDTALWDGGQGRFQEILYRRPLGLAEEAAAFLRPPRFVFRSSIHHPLLPASFSWWYRRTEEALMALPLEPVILRMPLLYGPDRPDSTIARVAQRLLRPVVGGPDAPALRVEQAALATLRAALEPGPGGIMEPPEIAVAGDVMIPQ